MKTKPNPRDIVRNADALRDTLAALGPLSFEERIRVIRWACDFYGIARVALYQGDGTFKEQT